MNVIFTYCTLNNCAEIDDFFLMMSKVAFASAKANIINAKTILYCDSLTKTHFHDIPYLDEIIEIDYTKYNFNKTFWNFPKILSYSMQQEEFVHLDLDVAIIGKIDFSKKQFISEKIRNFNKLSSELLYADTSKPIPDILYCSGIFGGSCHDVFHKLYEISLNNKDNDFSYEDLYSLEECYMTQQILSKNIDAFIPNQKSFIHFWNKPKEQYMPIIEVLSHMYKIQI